TIAIAYGDYQISLNTTSLSLDFLWKSLLIIIHHYRLLPFAFAESKEYFKLLDVTRIIKPKTLLRNIYNIYLEFMFYIYFWELNNPHGSDIFQFTLQELHMNVLIHDKLHVSDS
ncbi:hypothetical protein ACJX0J_020512, partial [Zea mays]